MVKVTFVSSDGTRREVEIAEGETAREAALFNGVPGIDGVYVGPGDLALAMGLPLLGGRTAEQQQRLDVAIDSVVMSMSTRPGSTRLVV